MISRAVILLFMLAHASAQSVCPSSDQFVATKPVCVGSAACCTAGNVVNIQGKSGTISDGEIMYGNNVRCVWTIGPLQNVMLRFNSFSTETEFDTVQLFSCEDAACTSGQVLGIFSGDTTNVASLPVMGRYYTTTAPYMRIRFMSDANTAHTGFDATWIIYDWTKNGYPVCVACPSNMQVNQTSLAVEMAKCECNPGWVGSLESTCESCAAGKYKSSSLHCSVCPSDSVSAGGTSSCQCLPGYEGEVPFRPCTACVPGKFKATEKFACAVCPTGTISESPAATVCKLCEVGMTSSADRLRCEACPDGQQFFGNGTCQNCSRGFFSSVDSNRKCVQCPSGFYSTAQGTAVCTACRACPDGFHRTNCSFSGGGGKCTECRKCGAGLVNVGCMNRAGHTDEAGECRNRTYVVRTPLCDEKASGYGLGGYTFLALFGKSQDDASFQCRRRCDNAQNKLSDDVYKDKGTYADLIAQFPSNGSVPRVFNGGHCGGPYACDVANCNIPGSSDDSQTDYQPRLACPVYLEPATVLAFWKDVDVGGGVGSSLVASVDAKRAVECQTCASCGLGRARTDDWGRGCARDCTQLTCAPGLIFDWTEPLTTAKCKACGDLDDVRLCVSSEQRAFEGYDVSGRLPKVFMRQCSPKRDLPARGYEHTYGNCEKCLDFADVCVNLEQRDVYYHTCEDSLSGIVATCRACSRANGREPTASSFWDGRVFQHLYCQQEPCSASAGVSYTGIHTATAPDRICNAVCEPNICDTGQVSLPCVLPHQARCKDAVDMDASVVDVRFRTVSHTPAHSNILEPDTTTLHLFSSFENTLVDVYASRLSSRAQCVWNADFIPDNSMNPGGISSRFERDCRPSTRDPRIQYPLSPLQNTVTPNADRATFPRRVLLNTSAHVIAYSAQELERPPAVFAGDLYLQLNLTNTNNATVAVFVPSDRRVEIATWVPRWRASVQARLVTGESISLLLNFGQEQTCFACFSLKEMTTFTATVFVTASLATATAEFVGDKFAFKDAPGLLVCERAVQARAQTAIVAARIDTSLSAFFASSLTDACVSRFGVNSHSTAFPVDLMGSSGVVSVGSCVLYLFSASNVYCLRRAFGTVSVLAWQTPRATAQGTLLDVTVHDGVLVRTLHSGFSAALPGENTNYVSFASSLDSVSETVLSVPGLLMFARGAPRFFLRRKTTTTLELSKFETQNATFRLNSSAGYATNDVKILFSRFVPVSAANTLLDYNDDVLLFATAKYSGQQVFVYVSTLDLSLVLQQTYGMAFAVFVLERGTEPRRVDDAYETMQFSGEALLSAAWLSPRLLLLSVAIDGAVRGQFAPMQLNVSDLTVLRNTQHPDLLQAFEGPFVRAANAVVSRGELHTCSECMPASANSSSGFFAYGASPISYRRLLACDEENVYMEDGFAMAMPVQSCAQVRRFSGEPFTNVIVDLALRCIELKPLEVLLELPRGSSVDFNAGKTYSGGPLGSRLLVTAECPNLVSVLEAVVVYDSSSCSAGCAERLSTNLASLRMSGAVRVLSVRHRPKMTSVSMTWDRRLLLLGIERASYSWKQLARTWQEHSVTVRSISPLQQVDFSVRRDQSIARLALVQDSDPEHSVALDALAVLPVMSEHFVPKIEADNTSFLFTIVYVPTVDNLRVLALEELAYGDNVHDWARVHASLHLSLVPYGLGQCSYLARIVAVDDFLLFVAGASATTGCLLDLAMASQCHLELPASLALPMNRAVGIKLSAVTPGCRALTEADDLSVEFAPFMRISQCPAHSFLHADTLTCTECDAGAQFCGAGQYVEGCLPLIHPSIARRCLACPTPNNSSFPVSSRGCAAWQCHEDFYRADTGCARCTRRNATGATPCRATAGMRFEACTRFENERCVACDPKPRYTEWTLTTTECSTRCRDGYFASATGCEQCATFVDTVGALGVSGVREAGKFYRFAACSATEQARAEVCTATDFSAVVRGAYVRDGRAFGEDCLLECANNSNTHTVRVNSTRGVSSWRAFVCVDCPTTAWPVNWRGANLPREAFDMSTSCVPTCLRSAGYFAGSDASQCLFCPSNCALGEFRSARDNCTACLACDKTLQGGSFFTTGAYNDARSCGERCPASFYKTNNQTCTPHSNIACVVGVQYAIAGTDDADAACGTCAECAFARQTSPCTLAKNRECVSCGELDAWSSSWSRSGCELLCRTEQGYTKLYTAGGEVCRKCLPCPPGQALSARPANCTCTACAVGIPSNALYTKGCEWVCPLYHVARTLAGALVCEYTLRPTSNALSSLRAESPVSCPPGQRLAQASAVYSTFACENCTTPAGLRASDLDEKWRWGRACAWQCAWGLQKQVSSGVYSCESIHYTHRTINASAPATHDGGLPVTHIIGLVVAGVFLAVFSLCFLARMIG